MIVMVKIDVVLMLHNVDWCSIGYSVEKEEHAPIEFGALTLNLQKHGWRS